MNKVVLSVNCDVVKKGRILKVVNECVNREVAYRFIAGLCSVCNSKIIGIGLLTPA